MLYSLKNINFKRLGLISFFFSFFIIDTLQASNYYVNDNALTGDKFTSVVGNNSNNGTSPSTPKATLTNVLSTYAGVLTSGDTIFVDAGTYYRSDRDLTISIGISVVGAGIGVTIFDNDETGTTGKHFVELTSSVTLKDFTIRRYGRNNTKAHAIDVATNVTGVKLINIQTERCGSTGGLYTIEIRSGAGVTIQGGGSTCNTTWTYAGGIRIVGATTNVSITNYLFMGNSRQENGSALRVENGTVNVYNTRFDKNDVYGGGEGAAVYQSGGNLSIYDSHFKDNTYAYLFNEYGGCILIGGGTFVLKRSIVENTVGTSSSVAYGAGMNLTAGSATVDSCYFFGNSGARGHDINVKGGTLTAFNCTFGSASAQIGVNGGTFTYANSGNPGKYTGASGSFTTTNTTAPSYTANPVVPSYTGACPNVVLTEPCIPPTIAGASICSGQNTTLSATAPGGTYEWYTAVSGGTLFHTGNSYTTSILTADTTFYVSTTLNGCATRTSVKVTVNTNPVAPTISGTTTICSGNNTTLTASAPGGTYSWFSAASGGIAFHTGDSYTTSNLIADTTLFIELNNGTCSSSTRTSITVAVISNPVVPTITGTTSICSGNNTTLTATAPGGTYSWFQNASGGVAFYSGSSYTTTNLLADTTFFVQANNGTCSSISRTSVTVTVIANPDAPTIVGTTSICSGNSTTLSVTAPGGVYNWYSAMGGGNLFFTGDDYTTSNLTADTTFYVSTSSGSCSSTTRTPITVSVNALDDASFNYSSGTYCDVGTALPTITGLAGGSFSAAPAGIVFVDVNPISNTGEIDLVASASGTYTITYTTSGTCPFSSTQNLTITTNPADPSFSYASASYCQGPGSETPVFTTGSSGVFTFSPAGLVIDAQGVINLDLSDIGNYDITNTISGGGCASVDHTVNVIIDNAASAFAGIDSVICADQVFTLNGSIGGAASSLTWSTPSDGLFDDINNPFATYTPSVTDTTNGFIWLTITTDDPAGTCLAGSDSVLITFKSLPSAPSGSNSQTFCNAAVIGDLSPSGNGIQWYDAASGGSVYLPNVVLDSGFHYYASQTTSGCESTTRLDVEVHIIDPLTPSGASTQSFCNAATVGDLTPSGIDIIWYDAPTAGNAYLNSSALDSGFHYYATQVISGCESTIRLDVEARVEKPSAPNGNAIQTFCNAATVSDLSVSGLSVLWYDAPLAGNLLAMGDALVDGNSYYASQTINGCEGELRLEVSVIIESIGPPSGNSVQIFCNAATVADLNASGLSVQWYDAPVGGSVYLPTTPLDSGFHYYASQTDNGCESMGRLDVEVLIDDPSAPQGAANQLFCEQGTIADLIPSGVNIVWYDALSGGSAYSTNVSLQDGNTYYASSLTANGCESQTRLSVLVSIQNTDAPTGIATQSFCNSATIADLSPAGVNINWYDAPLNGNLYASTSTLVHGNQYYATQIINGCESQLRLEVSVLITIPSAPTGNGLQQFCNSGTIADLIPSGSIIQWYDAPTGGTLLSLSDLLVNGSTYYATQIINNCESSLRLPVVVLINPSPLAPDATDSLKSICKNGLLQLFASSNQTYLIYTWSGPNNYFSSEQNPIVTNNATSTVTGNYYVTVTDTLTKCSSLGADSTLVELVELAALFSPMLTSGYAPYTVSFENHSVNATSYLWTFNDQTTSSEKDPSYIFNDVGQFSVFLIAYNGTCVDTAFSTSIDVIETTFLEVPNVFTPNDDFVNDVFNVKGGGLSWLAGKIYNRWGEMVYEWESITLGWNGTTMAGLDVPEGTYFYVIHALGNNNQTYHFQGSVMLIR